jgi:hypothetical protein
MIKDEIGIGDLTDEIDELYDRDIVKVDCIGVIRKLLSMKRCQRGN